MNYKIKNRVSLAPKFDDLLESSDRQKIDFEKLVNQEFQNWYASRNYSVESKKYAYFAVKNPALLTAFSYLKKPCWYVRPVQIGKEFCQQFFPEDFEGENTKKSDLW